ncbi:Ribosomal RNA large subunit methyltransferase A [Bacillus badius]|uniref:Ribosomal RNA large subunit methyltransferase A n=2 Tax=Bacillus badius TaxID=1455 RepID=A0ABR5AQP5_BACBA|nr:Ribosomal RNA large subunit methyltransferase A [Bacillus badius]
MFKMNKRMKSAEYSSNFESIFKCPICNSSMKVFELKSLICSNNHTFDFTKQGYINLTAHPVKTKYSKDLFEARRKFIVEDGFFKPLSQAIAETINKHAIKKETISLIDMGCGEGSHLSNISDTVSLDYNKIVMGVGIDLSKEGVLVAAKNYTDKIWAVADLANTPFKDKQFDVILNILSPSNYAEFNRLLKDDGLVVKVVPQSGYLKELREVIFDEPEKQSYSNVDTVERFNGNFQLVDCSRLCYTVALDNPAIQTLVQMTPLSWATSEEHF